VGQRNSPVCVLIADAELEVREALRLICEESLGFRVVAEACNSQTLLTQVQSLQPDMLLLDWDLPGMHPDTITAVKASHRHIIITGKRPELRSPALEAGADGFVYKGDPPDELLNLLRQFTETSSE
jgi:DNA-binding NarL/FixJ family response regulator